MTDDFDKFLAIPQHMAEFGAPVLSDLGNVERFVFLFGDRVRYCPPRDTGRGANGWYVWDGHRWRRDDMRTVELLAAKVSAAIHNEAAAILGRTKEDEKLKEAYRKWANATAMNSRIKAIIERAAVREEIARPPESFDANPWLLNLENGTYELRKGVFRAHDPKDLLTSLAPVTYDPEANSEHFFSFLYHATAANVDPGMLDWLQRFLGYCLSGDTSEQRFGLFCGKSETGKSTLLNIIRATLGPEYAGVVRSKSLFRPYDRESELDFNHVSGCRFVTCSEGREGGRLPEDFIKAITGAETLSMREMYIGAKEWHPRFKIVLGTNFRPTISESGNAIWRRMIYVPFENKIEKRDNQFADKVIERERPGVLRWLLAGLAALIGRGFEDPPESVKKFIREYRSEEDIVNEFLDIDCEVYGSEKLPPGSTVNEDTMTTFADLYAVFRHNLLELNEEEIISSKKFSGRLDISGIQKGERIGKKRLKSRRGIQLSSSGQEKLHEVEELKSRRHKKSLNF